MRSVADIAERYGNGDIRLTVQQNLVIPNIPATKIGALTEEPIFNELPESSESREFLSLMMNMRFASRWTRC